MAQYKRILLKLVVSRSWRQTVWYENHWTTMPDRKEIADMGVHVGIVIGGGNIFEVYGAKGLIE